MTMRVALLMGSLSLLLAQTASAEDPCAYTPGCCAPQASLCVPEATCCAPNNYCAPCEQETCCPAEPGCGCPLESCVPTYDDCTLDSCCQTACGAGAGAGAPGDGDDPFSLASALGMEDSGFNIGGWTQFGYHTDSNTLFNDHDSKIHLHQQWLFLEKAADGSDGLDWGGRIDFMYGVDAADTQAFGNTTTGGGTITGWDNTWNNGSYGWALPQAYLEVASGDLSIKAGHFFTLIGYEVVTAPDNFFYSHAYTMFNSEPFTHTGVLATYTVSDSITAYGGWTLGWDTGFDQFGGGSNFLGGASAAVTDDVTVTYITTIGDFGQRGDGYSHSIVVDTALTEDLNYVIQSDVVSTNAQQGGHQIGVNQYLLYDISDDLRAGGRLEWWKDGGQSQYAITGGVNVNVLDNLIVRPELRHDWNPAQNNEFTTFGIDAILTY